MMFNMVETNVKRIGGTFYARIPAGEARRLGIHEGTPVEMQVRLIRRGAQDLMKLKGMFKGQFASGDSSDLWGE